MRDHVTQGGAYRLDQVKAIIYVLPGIFDTTPDAINTPARSIRSLSERCFAVRRRFFDTNNRAVQIFIASTLRNGLTMLHTVESSGSTFSTLNSATSFS
jgi:hypothetical protein